jgi:hypothetical protein
MSHFTRRGLLTSAAAVIATALTSPVGQASAAEVVPLHAWVYAPLPLV